MIWIDVPAWALAMAAIFLGGSLPTIEWSAWSIAFTGATGGLLGGILLGAVTGIVARDLQPLVDEQRWALRGKVCAVTGANSGIGRKWRSVCHASAPRVPLLCRRPAEGERLRQLILARQPDAEVLVVTCDVGNFVSIRRAAAQILAEWPRLDVLVHNAGATFPQRTKTVDGIEATLAVDVVGPFLLTALLRGRLEEADGRVIMLTGIYQRKGHVE